MGKFFLCVFSFILCNLAQLNGYVKNLAWNGGPLHMECEHGPELWIRTGQHVKENVVVVKAIPYKENIYVITPRMKTCILSSLWLLVRTKDGIELQPYPDVRSHNLGQCDTIQNAIDFYLDHLGKLWILDSGIIDTLSSPKCTCPPKVVGVNLLWGKITDNIDISALVEPASLLQNIVVEYALGGKAFIYASDAARGVIIVHEVTSGEQWSVVACAPATGLQMALIKRPTHAVVVLIRLHFPSIIELDTTVLRRKDSHTPVTIFNEHGKPVMLLGADGWHVYLRHLECSDVLVWNTQEAYNSSKLNNVHSAGPRLTTTSVAAEPLKQTLLILDSNYVDTIHVNTPTYHKITFVSKYIL